MFQYIQDVCCVQSSDVQRRAESNRPRVPDKRLRRAQPAHNNYRMSPIIPRSLNQQEPHRHRVIDEQIIIACMRSTACCKCSAYATTPDLGQYGEIVYESSLLLERGAAQSKKKKKNTRTIIPGYIPFSRGVTAGSNDRARLLARLPYQQKKLACCANIHNKKGGLGGRCTQRQATPYVAIDHAHHAPPQR